jgi:hypothetical protein
MIPTARRPCPGVREIHSVPALLLHTD